MNHKEKQSRLNLVYHAIDELIDVDEVSVVEALDLLHEVQADISGRIDGLESDLENDE